jgi:hypothetical protein|tara:strand:- start:269 stop:622 length:354 start_codon:yes stop_codon:yes gene_type:complete
MTMHLLPAYWTTTNHKKRKKKKLLTPRMEKELKAHEKFLSKMGVDSSYTRTPTPLKTEQLSKQLPSRNIKDYEWRIQTKRVVKEYKGNAVLGQAYNKGNLVVLSATEAKDSATGKRR